MSARVLIVDDIEANLRLLEAKLEREYYTTTTASCGEDALVRARQEQPDIILLDVMMPGMDGFETCERLKADPLTSHIPVVMITALDERENRLRGLEVGAEDFLLKPIDDVQLMARMRSLNRLKLAIDELRSREASGRRLGAIQSQIRDDSGEGAHVLVVEDNPKHAERIRRALSSKHSVALMGVDPEDSRKPELIIVSIASEAFDGLKLVANLRVTDGARSLPILAVAHPDQLDLAVRALDLGAHDIIYRPVDGSELAARARTLIKRARRVQAMREALDLSIEMAVTDQLTGLHNRRFLMGQLQPLMQRAVRGGEPVTLLLVDVDHFKRVNDTHGHDVGDAVLKEVAARLASNFRPIDIVARYGGEEFAVVMPNTRGDYACLSAERLRRHMAGAPFLATGLREPLDVTISVGVAVSGGSEDTLDKLLKRADQALYRAKSEGRNRVIAQAA